MPLRVTSTSNVHGPQLARQSRRALTHIKRYMYEIMPYKMCPFNIKHIVPHVEITSSKSYSIIRHHQIS